MIQLTIPSQVVYDWQSKFDDILQHGVDADPTYPTYAKVEAAKARVTRIDANAFDLAEIIEECEFKLDSETDICLDAELRAMKLAYQRLLASAQKAQALT